MAYKNRSSSWGGWKLVVNIAVVELPGQKALARLYVGKAHSRPKKVTLRFSAHNFNNLLFYQSRFSLVPHDEFLLA